MYSAKVGMDHKEHGFSSSIDHCSPKGTLDYFWILTLADLLLLLKS